MKAEVRAKVEAAIARAGTRTSAELKRLEKHIGCTLATARQAESRVVSVEGAAVAATLGLEEARSERRMLECGVNLTIKDTSDNLIQILEDYCIKAQQDLKQRRASMQEKVDATKTAVLMDSLL